MATSSDSEAFESADEDFIEETKMFNENIDKQNYKKDALELATKSTPATPNQTESIVVSTVIIQDMAKDTEIQSNKENVENKESPEILMKKGNNKISDQFTEECGELSKNIEDIMLSTERKEILEEKIHEKSDKMKKKQDKKGSSSKIELEETIVVCVKQPIDKNDENIEKPKEDSTKTIEPDNDADGWEFDNWDYEAPSSNVTTTKEEETTKNIIGNKEPLNEREESSESGWDIDDWDNTVEVKTVRPKEEKTKSHKKSDFFGNISKLIISSEEPPHSFQSGHRPEETSSKISTGDSSYNLDNWGRWGKSWGGVASLLSTASVSVASISSQVSSAIESSIGVPDPRELARRQKQEKEISSSDIRQNISSQNDASSHSSEDLKLSAEQQQQQIETNSIVDGQSFGNFVSGFTQIGNRMITGGLDTLEGIGKKTMTILQENDAGLLTKQKELLNRNGPVLSQILREAKEKTEESESAMKLQQEKYKKQLHFETLFDDYHGLVHLEALEMLSHQSQLKIESLLSAISGRVLSELKETLNEVKELCELPEQEDDSDGNHTIKDLENKIAIAIADLGVPIDFNDIFDCWKKSVEWLETAENLKPQDIHDKALRCLAETTALTVLRMHKLAELLLIKDRHCTADEADALVQLTIVMCWHLSGIAARFGGTLTKLENVDEANSLITSTFLEGTNSTSYIQNAFHLFIPIIQEGAV